MNKAADDGWTSLFSAAQRGHEAVVRELLEAGAYVNKATNLGITPLVFAEHNGHRAIARLLTDAGAVYAAPFEGLAAIFGR